MDSAARRLATHAAALRFEDLPDAAVAAAKVFVLDTLGVGVAGATAEGATEVLAAARLWGAGQEAAVWGTAARLPAPQAALVNGFQVHAQEYDCLHEGAVVHALATLLPAALAFAERRGGVTGRELIASVAAGVDVACRLGLAAREGLRFFRPATAGGFGAAAALAHLAGFDAARTLAALGLQYGQTSGTMQAHVEGSPVLPLQVGVNARAAVQAADLAGVGLPGLADPFEGRWGYLRLFEGDSYDWGDLLESLGSRFLIAEFSHKPYPAGRATHAAIEGVIALRREVGFAAEEVAEVVVTAPPLIHRLVNRPDLPSPTPNYARLCLPFMTAKALLHGAVRLTDVRGREAIEDPATHALAAKVRMEPDGGTDQNALAPQTVVVRLTDGRTLRREIPAMLAGPTRPLTRAQHLAKFRDCWRFAAAPLGEAAGEALIGMVDGLERAEDVREIAALLGPAEAG
jgi:aconitate decarboxylase